METKRFNSNDILLESIIGKSLQEGIKLAKSNGFLIRVTREDDERFFVTQELRPDRINLEIDNEKITSARIG
jgi:hypothetical protein